VAAGAQAAASRAAAVRPLKALNHRVVLGIRVFLL